MEKFFKLKENGTSVKIEFIAGITTFVTMAYIIMVNPAMLATPFEGTDMYDKVFNGVFFATCLSAFLGTFLMGVLAKLPFAQAPGMGMNAFFTYTVMLGIRTDVIDRCKKAIGMRMLLRSMSPDVIAVDELGSMEDFQAVDEVSHCGCSILGTIHAADMLELQQKEQLQKWVEQKIFERYVILKKDDEGRRHFMIYDGAWEKIWSD